MHETGEIKREYIFIMKSYNVQIKKQLKKRLGYCVLYHKINPRSIKR